VRSGLAELVERWPDVVGPPIARNAWPARIGRDGTLHVSTADSVWAFELGHRAAEIATGLGVVKVRFAPGPLPSMEAAAVADAPLAPDAEERRRATEIAAAVENENLRESVQKAVALSLARQRSDRSF